MKIPKTAGLNRSQLHTLLSLAVGESGVADPQAGILRTMTASGKRGDEYWRQALDSQTSADELRQIKDTAKLLHEESKNENERAAATALYYLAVAAARVLWGSEISTMPVSEQDSGFEAVAETCGDSARDILRRAVGGPGRKTDQ